MNTTTPTAVRAGLGTKLHVLAESGKGDKESNAHPVLCGVRAFRHRVVTSDVNPIDCPRCLAKVEVLSEDHSTHQHVNSYDEATCEALGRRLGL